MIIAAAQSASVPGDIAQNASHHLRFAEVAAERGVRLLVFPELSLTGYEPTLAAQNTLVVNDSRLDTLRNFARDAEMTIVAGAPVTGMTDASTSRLCRLCRMERRLFTKNNTFIRQRNSSFHLAAADRLWRSMA